MVVGTTLGMLLADARDVRRQRRRESHSCQTRRIAALLFAAMGASVLLGGAPIS